MRFIILGLDRSAIYFSFFIFFFSSCIIGKETFPVQEEEPLQELLLNIQVPGLSQPATKGLTATEESQVETLDILVFELDGADEKYAYHTFARKIENRNNDPLQYTFATELQASRGDETYRFVLLANLVAEIDPDIFTIGDSKENILKQILFSPAARWGDDKIAGTSSLLPMWGESAGTHKVDENLTATKIGTISLVRSVARVNIELETGDSFYMEEVQVYNTHTTGMAVPALTNSSVTGTITHTHTPADNTGFINEIYLAETMKEKEPAILIGGYYTPTGATPNTTEKTWYKIILYDYNETDPYNNPLDILRNHYYRINITAIYGPGYATIAEAKQNPSVDLGISLHVYDETGEINYIVYNNLYMLGVSGPEFKCKGDGDTQQEIVVLTDYDLGWTYEITDSPEEGGNPVTWITNITRTTNAAGTKDKFVFDVEEGAGIKRRAYVHFTAGTLRQVVTITQRGLPNSYLLKPGAIMELPVRKAYMVWEDDILGDQKQTLTGAVTTDIIWQDVQDMVTVTLNGSGDQGDKTKLLVTANGADEGNAVVGVYIGGTLRYSWHIWVTAYDPDTKQNGTTYLYNNGFQDYLFMDRNLGATTATPGAVTTLGNHYQWGRKDPFPGTNSVSATTQKTIYGTQIVLTTTPATTASTTSNNVHHTLIYPFRYYYMSGQPSDWFTTQNNNTYQNNYLWSDEDGDKGIFDPCPDGWRVPDWIRNASGAPQYSPWNGWSTGNFTWNAANRGRTYGGAFYPAAGYRYYGSGAFDGVGTDGFCWSASPNGINAGYYLYFYSSKVFPAYATNRASGLSVRCVQE